MIAALEMALIKEDYGDEDIVSVLMDTQNAGGEKAHKKGADWLRGDIARLRARNETKQEKTAAKSQTKNNSSPPPRDPTEPPIEAENGRRGFNLTDYGNAERFVAQHGHRLRYCYKGKTSLYWTDEYWERDES